MKTKRLFVVAFMACVALALVSCGSSNNRSCNASSACEQSNCKEMKKYQKKYTNADFYKDGVLQQDVVKAAYQDIMAFYGVPWTETLEKDFWAVDFGLGDMEHVGMGGIFWYNDPVHGYFGHEIYLLPGQMIPEHWHVKTEYPAKHESWKVNHGWAYNFGIGHATPNSPALPESQKGFIQTKNFVVQHVDEVLSLKEKESPHFLMAGDEGAIITEYGTYHDGAGLRFSNPKVQF